MDTQGRGRRGGKLRDLGRLPSQIGREALEALRTIVPAAGASFYAVDVRGEPFGHLLDGLSADQLRDYQSVYRKVDPLHPSRFQRSNDSVVTLDQARRRAGDDRYVSEFLEIQGFVDEVELFFRDRQGLIVLGIGLLRARRDGRFCPGEVDLLSRTRPLLEYAFRTQIGEARMPEHETAELCSTFDLTGREIEIARLVRRGLSNGDIAETLGIRVATVKAHLFNAFNKVGVASRTELISRLWRY
ncbi:MAG TPA: LuxR C-terminal-related transcriptional regulator [Sphingomonadaceae bacterium]